VTLFILVRVIRLFLAFRSFPLLPNEISTSASSELNDIDVMSSKRHKSLHASASASEQSVSSNICNIDLAVEEDCVSIDNDTSFSDDDQKDLYPLSQVSLFSTSRSVIHGNNLPSSQIYHDSPMSLSQRNYSNCNNEALSQISRLGSRGEIQSSQCLNRIAQPITSTPIESNITHITIQAGATFNYYMSPPQNNRR
jgi:hypothetical protein